MTTLYEPFCNKESSQNCPRYPHCTVSVRISQLENFTFMLPCIVTEFFLINQPDARIIPILFCYKTLHVSGIFSAHHQEFSTVHSALVSFMQVFDDHFQAESGWNILTLLGSGHQTCMKLTSVECTVENS